MRSAIVLGTCYGDEAKGVVTSFLAGQGDLVIRFNSGCQVGHTVIKNGYRHIYSSFGSGTMNGAHTYFSEYCTFYPKSFYNEREALISNGFNPVHYIHPLAMVTTPFDIDRNRQLEGENNHGSVGMGFGTTVNRHQNTPLKLYVCDLTYRPVLEHKLRQIAAYYLASDVENQIATFLSYVDRINLNICPLSDIVRRYTNVVFEGGQGIMLDMDHGYFPNVTRSNTTSKNAMAIIKENCIAPPTVYYAMRSYLTRHGNGFMPNETDKWNFEDQTNRKHKYQGEFRQGYHSINEIRYAIECDSIYSGNDYNRKAIAISCLDQTDNDVFFDMKRGGVGIFLNELDLPFGKTLINNSPNTETIKFI